MWPEEIKIAHGKKWNSPKVTKISQKQKMIKMANNGQRAKNARVSKSSPQSSKRKPKEFAKKNS